MPFCILFCFLGNQTTVSTVLPKASTSGSLPHQSSTNKTFPNSPEPQTKFPNEKLALPMITSVFQEIVKIKFSGSVQLNCSALGKPRPSVYWIQPGGNNVTTEAFGTDNVGLNVNGVDGGGSYVCLAINDVGNASVNVTVHGWYLFFISATDCDSMFTRFSTISVKPRVVLSSNTTASSSVIVTCTVHGYPPPNVVLILPNNSRTNGSAKRNGHVTLTIFLAVGQDPDVGGTYKCIAKNEDGDNATDMKTVNGE